MRKRKRTLNHAQILRLRAAFRKVSTGGSTGGARGGPPPPLFLDQTEARRAQKNVLKTVPPLSQGLDDRPPLISRYGSGTGITTYILFTHEKLCDSGNPLLLFILSFYVQL